MEDLTSQLSKSLGRDLQSHKDLYKQKASLYNQGERRLKVLELQKQRRDDRLSAARKIAFSDSPMEENNPSDEEGEAMDDDQEEPSSSPGKNQKNPQGQGKKPHNKKDQWRNQLMLAEEVEELPEDFESWKIILCPAGKRCLVVASQGRTQAFSRHGNLLKTFSSLLPGGSPYSQGNFRSDFSILDCVFEEMAMVFHVLDVMCWRSHPFYNCETDFRFFWLGAKLKEEKADESGPRNPFCFKQVRVVPATKDSVRKILSGQENPGYPLDGLILSCPEAHYEVGPTPVCLWIPKNEIEKTFFPS